MLIQRPECATIITAMSGPNSSSPKDIADIKMQQQQHIKRLLSTAAAATGIVGDVDALPGPGQFTQKAERNLWRLEEIREVLDIMQQINALEQLNDKTVKSEKVFRNIEQMMHRKGFRKKSHAQIWTKWKFLKSTYMTSRRNRIVPKMIPYEIYQTLHKMLISHVNTNAGNSNTTSIDGDNSNCDDSLMPEANVSDVKDERNELAHPIFGFRLGLVKSEPVDTGYETTGNNSALSEADSLDGIAIAAHNNFSPRSSNGNITQHSFIDIKEERVTNSPESQSPIEKPLECPPNSLLVPRSTASMTITAISNNEAAAMVNKSITSNGSLTLPPLRIAPFANERNMNEALRRINNSPPPLSMNPIAFAATQNTLEENGTSFIRKMLRNTETDSEPVLPANINALTTRPSVLRLPKEVTLQLRAPEIVTNTTRPSHSMPTRQQTAYSLRPDRSMSNINTVTPVILHQNQKSSPQKNNKNIPNYQQNLEEPMTSQMASQINAKIKTKSHSYAKQKKRRLDIPAWNDFNIIHPTKIMRTSSISASENQHHHDNESYDESYSEIENSFNTFKVPSTPGRSSPDAQSNTNSVSKQRALIEETIKELVETLQQTQTEMINKFFEEQMEIARQEHEFQMKQDRLIMESFRKQTRKLMESASQLFSVDSIVKNKAKKDTNHRNGNFEENKKNLTSYSKNEDDNIWPDEEDSSSSENMEDEIDNDNMETAVDPIQFVTSELVEEYDNS